MVTERCFPFFFSSRRRHTRCGRDWSSDVCSSDLTSRNQIWPPGQALDVPVLDPQVAAEFVVSRTGDTDRRAALELAGELGGLPLALEQVAAYVQASGESVAGYLALFLR